MKTFLEITRGEKIIKYKRVWIDDFKKIDKDKRLVIEVETNGLKRFMLVKVT